MLVITGKPPTDELTSHFRAALSQNKKRPQRPSLRTEQCHSSSDLFPFFSLMAYTLDQVLSDLRLLKDNARLLAKTCKFYSYSFVPRIPPPTLRASSYDSI